MSEGTPSERLHPLTPFVKGWVGLLAIAFFLGRSWLENGGSLAFDDLQWWAWIVIGGLALSVVVGLVTWRATTFRLDDDALRLQTNFIWNSSSVVNYSKIQSIDIVSPLAARLVGVCGLRIDVGSGAPQKLEYLGRRRAESLRDALARRAALVRDAERPVLDPTDPTGPGTPTDELAPRQVVDDIVVSVPPTRLVAAVVTSQDFLGSALFAAVALVPSIVTSRFAFAGLVVPAVWGLATLVLNRVVKEWNYRLHAPEPGVVRVARGLTDTVSQTVPAERVQGIELAQSWLWKRWGWWRVRFAVLGYAGDDANEGGSTVLLPVGTWDEVIRVLRTVWPDVDLDALDWQSLPRRSRWLHPVDWRQRGWAVSDRVVADRAGRFSPRMSVVALERMQSWHGSQGPLERKVGLAGFSVQISGSVVDVTVSGIEPSVARTVLVDLGR